MEEPGADKGRTGDGHYPSPDDAPRDAPAHGGKAPRCSNANDRARDGVRGANGNAEVRGAGESKRSGSLGGETAERSEFGDPLPHGLDDAPAAGHGAAAHGEVAAEDDPVRNVERLEQTAGDQRGGDNAHAFLGVVGTVAQALSSRRKELQAAKPPVNFQRALFLATAVPNTRAAIKFQKAAQATARNGVSTRVETTVAMELAASCQPLENSKVSVRAITTRSKWKLVTGGS